MIRCDACLGKKKLLVLGNLLKDCPYCRGIGFIDEMEDLKSSSNDIPIQKRKKKKIINETVLQC